MGYPGSRRPIIVLAALAAFASFAVRSVREPVLRAAGWALVTSRPITPADVIVLSVDLYGAGLLEAADLVQGGISKRVAIFTEPPSEEEREFIRRGGAFTKRCGLEDATTEVAWRDGFRANLQRRRI